MATPQQQSPSTNASLADADRKSVENFRQKIAEAPGSGKLLNQFNWDGAQRMPAKETPVRKGLNQSMGKLPEGIEIPARKKGDASILLVPASHSPVPYANLIYHIYVVPESNNQVSEAVKNTYTRQLNSTGAARKGYLFPPREEFSQKNANAQTTASLIQGLCGANKERDFFVTRKNSSLSCSLTRSDYLVSAGYMAKGDKKDKKDLLAALSTALPPSNWAVEIMSASNGKFNERTRDVLPGGVRFNQAIEARIARINYEADLDKKEGKANDPAKAIAAQRLLMSNSKENPLLVSLRNAVETGAEREFDDLNKTPGKIKVDRKSYVSERAKEFDRYLAGESTSFKLKKHYPTPLNNK